MAKSMMDITAAAETHLRRAENVLLRHADNVNNVVIFITLARQVVGVEGIEIDLVELQEQVRDMAEIVNSLRQDSLDILEAHIEFAKEVQEKMEELGRLGYYGK